MLFSRKELLAGGCLRSYYELCSAPETNIQPLDLVNSRLSLQNNSFIMLIMEQAHVYNDLQQEISDLIPVAYYARSFPGGRFIIIMEDLEERGIKPHWMGDTCSINHARATAIAQAKMHSRFWNSDRFKDDLSWVRPRSRRFGELWIRMAFKDSRERFLATELGRSQSVYLRDLIKQWDQNCITIYHYWETKPQTLLHGDPHLGNSLVSVTLVFKFP
jgi:hypothetical protein